MTELADHPFGKVPTSKKLLIRSTFDLNLSLRLYHPVELLSFQRLERIEVTTFSSQSVHSSVDYSITLILKRIHKTVDVSDTYAKLCIWSSSTELWFNEGCLEKT